MGILERLGDELFAAGGTPAGRSQQGRAVVERLVDHVPHGDAAAVASDHGIDVRLHAPQEPLAAGGLFALAEEPRRRPVVLGPNQAVADHLEMACGGELHQRIGLGEIEPAFRSLHRIRFQAILGRHRIELRGKQRPVCRPRRYAATDGDAHGKQAGGGVLQRARRARLGAESLKSEAERRGRQDEAELPRETRCDPRSMGTHGSSRTERVEVMKCFRGASRQLARTESNVAVVAAKVLPEQTTSPIRLPSSNAAA